MGYTTVLFSLALVVVLPIVIVQSEENSEELSDASVEYTYGEWSYNNKLPNGPDHWGEFFPSCGGQAQSPINIITSEAVGFSPNDFVFTNYDRVAEYTLKNSGHSSQVVTNVKDITVTGGGLVGTYVLEQFHFHWGKNSLTGSEHLLNNASLPLEIHFVHYNSDLYNDVASAAASGDPQGLAVLGLFATADLVGTLVDELGLIADNLVNVPYKGNTTTLPAFSIQNILSNTALGDFFRYSGSLTTPGCNEIVTWTVFRRPVRIASTKLGLFRQSRSNAIDEPEEILSYNYRPTQALNGRVVNWSAKGSA
jgi:carbonic anhydrase